jgi:hypothetical protein
MASLAGTTAGLSRAVAVGLVTVRLAIGRRAAAVVTGESVSAMSAGSTMSAVSTVPARTESTADKTPALALVHGEFGNRTRRRRFIGLGQRRANQRPMREPAIRRGVDRVAVWFRV